MIKINLLGDSTVRDNSGILFVAGYVASIAAVLVICFVTQMSINTKVDRATEEVTSLEADLALLQKKTKVVRDLEKKRKDLNDKLSVIARLKLSKTGPVRVLDDLNMALPEPAWIFAVAEKGNELRVQGYALDTQTIALFMTQLEKSDYYKSVDLVETKQASRKGVKLQSFTLNARIDYAGKINSRETADEDGKEKSGKAQTALSAANRQFG